MLMEIGSEFWKEKNSFACRNDTFFLSGRTAIDAIIRDAKNCYNINCAILPSYCCDSMIEPFLSNDMKVRFFEISIGSDGKMKASLPDAKPNEMILYMKYFGACNLNGLRSEMLEKWEVTIEDMTHSCFCEDYYSNALYSFESYRKWFALDGLAIARKKHGKISNPQSFANEEFVHLRNDAFELKKKYIEKYIGCKDDFLNKFELANDLLSNDYVDKAPTHHSVVDFVRMYDDIVSIRETRRRNASILIKGICNIKDINIMIDNNDSSDCPLFVSILVGRKKRDDLRKYLISQDIYCPIHWPLTKYHEGLTKVEKDIYDMELSLICDQRYDENDMNRIVMCINNYFNEEVY